MSPRLNLKTVALLIAIFSVVSAGIAYALIEFSRDVPASVTVELRFPDGIEVYSDAGLTQPVELLDFGEVEVDVFGTVGPQTPIPVWVENLSSSMVRLRVVDDFLIGEVLMGFGGDEPRPAPEHAIELAPDQVVDGQVALRFSETVEGPHQFVISFVAEGPITPVPTPAPTPTPTSIPTPTATPRPTATPAAGIRGGVLTYIPIQDCGLLDSIPFNDWCAANHQIAVQDQPFGLDALGEARPQMVGEWTLSPDGLTYTMTLRDGIMYHNGDPVLAETVVASINRWAGKAAAGRAIFEPYVTSMSALDARTFQFVLNEPIGLILPNIASQRLPVLTVQTPEDAALGPLDYAANLIGSGPFTFVSWQPGNQLIWDRWEGYVPRDEPTSGWAGSKFVMVDRVVNQFVVDPNTKAALLEAGEVDLVHRMSADLFPAVDANPNTIPFFDPQANTNQLRFNHVQPPSSNKLFRLAVAMAIDQAEYVAAMQPVPFARECFSIWGCRTALETTTDSENFLAPTDLTVARRLLAESGYNNEVVVLMAANNFTEILNAGIVTNAVLERLGVNVDFQQIPWTTMAEKRNVRDPIDQGGWSMFHTWSSAREPHESIFFNPDWAGWYENEEVEQLKQDYLRAPDLAARRAIAERLQVIFMDDFPSIIVGEHFGYSAMRSDVRDFINTPIHPFWRVWLDR